MIGMPNIPGLPNPAGLASSGLDALISFGGAFAVNRIFGEQWGVFNQFGVPVLLADNVTSVEFNNTQTVASAPLEKGTFASYNKVQGPYTATVQMTKGGGSATERGLFIGQLEALAKSTLLFHVLTPEYVHRNATITGFSYKRAPTDGARIIVANINLKEIREVGLQYDQEEVANPADQRTVDGGEVQAEDPGESLLSRGAGGVADFMAKLKEGGPSAAFGGLF